MSRSKYTPTVRATLKSLMLQYLYQGMDIPTAALHTATELSKQYAKIGSYNRGGVQAVYYQMREPELEFVDPRGNNDHVAVPISATVKEVSFNFDGLTIKVTTG